MKLTKAVIAFLAVAAVPAGLPAQETLEIPPEIMEAIQTDVATIHQALMQENIILPEGQAGAFWSIYDEYLAEVKTLASQRTELIKDFALAFETMTDEMAIEMGKRALAFDAERHQVVSKYFDRIAKEVGGMVAGQFLQIESRVKTIKDLRIELEVPVIGG